jgi:hypothetical protein
MARGVSWTAWDQTQIRSNNSSWQSSQRSSPGPCKASASRNLQERVLAIVGLSQSTFLHRPHPRPCTNCWRSGVAGLRYFRAWLSNCLGLSSILPFLPMILPSPIWSRSSPISTFPSIEPSPSGYLLITIDCSKLPIFPSLAPKSSPCPPASRYPPLIPIQQSVYAVSPFLSFHFQISAYWSAH